MRIVYFSHSVQSCWNNGNAHFQRGVLRALQEAEHDVLACEPRHGWSRNNLLVLEGPAAADEFAEACPALPVQLYDNDEDLEAATDKADVVIVHEWNDPAIIAALGRIRSRNHFLIFFHDTHHRAVSDPAAIERFDLSHYDGILAFGAAVTHIYERLGWTNRAYVWHEAADTSLFRPPSEPVDRNGAVWIGNWGDGERSAELESLLLSPARTAGISLDVHGVRYPNEALSMLSNYGARYKGWLPNHRVPTAFAAYCLTVHVPRRFYTQLLPGIPTIRVFEALACGIPLITAPWEDCEQLFTPGKDFLVASSGEQMTRQMRRLINEPDLAATLARDGLETISARHSCQIRANELLRIVDSLRSSREAA